MSIHSTKKYIAAVSTLGLLMLAGTTASAWTYTKTKSTCSKPTLSQCTDENYKPSWSCRTSFREACEALVSDEAERRIQNEADAQTLDEKAYAFESRWSSQPDVEETFEDTDGQGPTTLPPMRGSGGLLTWAEQFYETSQQLYTCEEYVFQRYYEYYLFAAVARYLGSDYEALFDYAYSYSSRNDGGIGYRGLFYSTPVRNLSGGGDPDDQLTSEFGTVDKSNFFNIDGEAFLEFRTRRPYIGSKIYNGRNFYDKSNPWLFHYRMKWALNNYDADELAYWRSKREALRGYLAQRYAWQARLGTEINRNGQTTTANEYEQRVEHYDDLIEDALVEANSAGCLDINDTGFRAASPCDWSYQDFYENVTNAYESSSNHQYDRCVERTGNAPTSVDSYHQIINNRPVRMNADPSQSHTAMTVYLERADEVEEWAREEYASGSSQPPTLKRDYTDGDQIGSDFFGASWNYDLGWEFVNNSATCETNITARANFDAQAEVLTMDQDLINLSSGLDLRDEAYHFQLTILQHSAYEEELWDESYNGSNTSTYMNVVVEPDSAIEKSKTIELADSTFTVFGFPVTVTAGVTGKVGLDTRLDLDIRDYGRNGNCAYTYLGARGQVTPYAEISGYADAGIGISGLRAGAGADVNVVDARLPVTLNMQAYTRHRNYSDLWMDIDANVALDLTALGGRVFAFVEYPVGIDVDWGGVDVVHDRSTRTLFSEEEISFSQNLLHADYSMEKSTLEVICNTNGVDCEQ